MATRYSPLTLDNSEPSPNGTIFSVNTPSPSWAHHEASSYEGYEGAATLFSHTRSNSLGSYRTSLPSYGPKFSQEATGVKLPTYSEFGGGGNRGQINNNVVEEDGLLKDKEEAYIKDYRFYLVMFAMCLAWLVVRNPALQVGARTDEILEPQQRLIICNFIARSRWHDSR